MNSEIIKKLEELGINNREQVLKKLKVLKKDEIYFDAWVAWREEDKRNQGYQQGQEDLKCDFRSFIGIREEY